VKKLKILSGGAAHGLVSALAPRFEAETGHGIDGEFGPVGRMAARLRAGEVADLVILTSALIAELAREGYVAGDSAADIGVVHTAVAVRAGDPAPSVADAAALKAALVGADAIYFPDPEQATAGIHFVKVLRGLGMWDEIETRLRPLPSGAAAMRALAAARSARPIGCTQATEILSTPGVTLVGSLPEGCDLATTYTAAVGARTEFPEPAHHLVAFLTGEGSRETRTGAGFA
jgi:molybdate transport system substrate-binding protein